MQPQTPYGPDQQLQPVQPQPAQVPPQPTPSMPPAPAVMPMAQQPVTAYSPRPVKSKLPLRLSIVTAVVLVVGALGIIVFKQVSGNHTATVVLKGQDGQKTSLTTKKTSSAPEAFGIKVGMARTDVEQVLGQPSSLSAAFPACSDMSSSAKALGYDTSCTYQQAMGNNSSPTGIGVNYLDSRVIGATKINADGSMTILSKDGVNTISAKTAN